MFTHRFISKHGCESHSASAWISWSSSQQVLRTAMDHCLIVQPSIFSVVRPWLAAEHLHPEFADFYWNLFLPRSGQFSRRSQIRILLQQLSCLKVGKLCVCVCVCFVFQLNAFYSFFLNCTFGDCGQKCQMSFTCTQHLFSNWLWLIQVLLCLLKSNSKISSSCPLALLLCKTAFNPTLCKKSPKFFGV